MTQVSASEAGHTFHNRLGHSLKVAQVGRRNAERLKVLVSEGEITGAAAELIDALDADAVETSCLAHDLGHPPFGHVAEHELDVRAREHGEGFEGNAQSFRIVTRLAVRSNDSQGLDLTRQSLDGMLKYPWARDREHGGKKASKWGYYRDDEAVFKHARRYHSAEAEERPSLEAESLDWADDLTYAVHDVDDFYRAGLVPLERLIAPDGLEMRRFKELMTEAREAEPGAFPKYEIDDLAAAVLRVLQRHGPSEPFESLANRRAEMREFGSQLITRYLEAFSLENDDGLPVLRIQEDRHMEVAALKQLTWCYVVRSPALAVVQHGQKRLVAELWTWYFDASKQGGDHRLFPQAYRERLHALDGTDEETAGGRSRLVADLISGLTETAAVQLHQRLASGATPMTFDATARRL